MKIKTVLSAMAAVFAFAGSALADSDPLVSDMKAFVIEAGADGELNRVETDEVEPGDVVEYELTYRNVSEVAVSGLIISVPVPTDTEFVPMSATGTAEAVFEVSIDNGSSWAVPPLFRDTEAGREEVPAAEYDLVRWVPKFDMYAGTEWKFGYQVKVD